MGFKCRIVVSLLFVSPALAHAQEVKYIDLAFVRATDRTTPSANAAAGLQEWQVHRGWYRPDGAPDQRDLRALGAYLLHVTPTEIHRAKFSIRGGKLIGHTVYCVVDFSARIRVAGLAVYERFGLLSQ